MVLENYVAALQATLAELPLEAVAGLVDTLAEAWRADRQVLTCGNGGSASTASHLAADLAKNVAAPGQRRLRVLPLTDNLPQLTAWANDAAYAEVFAEQVRTYGRPGDVLIAISGSGNSPNVLNAVRLARERGLYTIGLSGFDGGQLRRLVDWPVHVANDCMEQVEDAHLMIGHMAAVALRQQLRAAEIEVTFA